MSGVEAAGFILAAFPLCISALEHYRDAAEVLGNFWKIQREYKKWKHNLDFCRLGFEQNLEELLLPLIADEDELQELIADPGGLQWSNPELEKRLRQRLPKSYDLYLGSIDHVREVMIQLKHELGVKKASFQSRVVEHNAGPREKMSKLSLENIMTKANLEYQAQRLRMSFNQSKRDKLFNEFTDYNNELRTLLDTSDRIAALRQGRRKAKRSTVSKGLWQFWRHADNLYNLLVRSWRCDCKAYHVANLMLQHRTTPTANFQIMFVFAQQSLMPKPWSWNWQETTIRMLENDSQTAKANARSSTPTTDFQAQAASSHASPQRQSPTIAQATPGEPIGSRKSFMRKFRRGRTTIALLPSVPEQPKPVPIVAVRQPMPRVAFTDSSHVLLSADGMDMADIKSLCETIAKSGTGHVPYGCLKNEFCVFAVSPATRQASTGEFCGTISLQSLLSKDSEITLTRYQRYSIALTLASSYLQLQSTPWICSQWSKNDVLFLHDRNNPEQVILNQPYLSRNFQPSSHSQVNPADRSLSNLGIMLLELCFGTALEDHRLRQKYATDDNVSNPFLDLAAALEWCPRAAEEAGTEYADAITWCLYNAPGSGESDGKPGKWREELFVRVVEPIQYYHDQLKAVVR